jgi:alkaline phosphatase
MTRYLSVLILLVFTGCLMPVTAFPQQFAKIPVPKNIIIMIGDGMGFNAVGAATMYAGKPLVFEGFPVAIALAHYPAKAGSYSDTSPKNIYAQGYNTVKAWTDTGYVRHNYTESAAAATAMATGFKTYNNAIGMSLNHDTLINLTETAKASGRAAGVITSVPFSHATPAGFIAHDKSRIDYSTIAFQELLNSRCDVIMGCGNPEFTEDGKPVEGKWESARYVGDSTFWMALKAGSGKEKTFTVNGTARTVGDCNGDGKPDPWTVVTALEDFTRLTDGPTPLRVLGCPEVYSTLQQARPMKNGENNDSSPYITPFNTHVPTLAVMAKGALNVLDNNPNGFFLMIEGGAIDWAAHGNQKGRLIEEVQSFNAAVEAVISWVNTHSNWDETLLIVTADHETGYLWGGTPYTPLKSNGAGKLPGIQFNSDDHTNSLVPFFAKGAGSDVFRVMADETDTVRGPYIQNAEIAQGVFFMWGRRK